MAVWWIGIKSGLFITALAGVAWWFANLDTHPYITILGYLWALVNREFYFLRRGVRRDGGAQQAGGG
jgi:hypothetical protein